MIPKIIHYCWFGENPLPELAQKCIESWRKFCPDYEIKRWDESNFDINCCDYVREAYEAKKWAFVSDYARFKILYDNGGLYFDTDVELIKPTDDIVKKGSFLGCEVNPAYPSAINPGLGMGAETRLPIYQEILDIYESIHFLNVDGTLNDITITDRITAFFEKIGFQPIDKVQTVASITIYPPRYFCPLNIDTGKILLEDDTRSIHHYTASWCTSTQKENIRLRQKYIGKYGKTLGEIFYLFPYSVFILRHDGPKAFWGKVKKKLKREK